MNLDTLKILIEADASGLQSQLKSATNTITSFVSSMNKQEVDWTSILSRTISPAIISGIAASFAMAIESAVSFQNAMQLAGANSQASFNAASDQMSSAALGISNATGASAAETAAALGKLTQLFGKDTPTAIAATNEAAQLASITGMSLADTVNMLIPIFDAWGIKTVPQVTQAVTDLYTASQNGKIPLKELADTLANSGVALQGKTTFQDAAIGIEEISNQAGMTKDTTVAAFNAIAQAVLNPYNNLNILSGGVGALSKALDTGGIVAGFEKVSDAIHKSGLPLSLFAQYTNLSTEATKSLGAQTDTVYANTSASIKNVIANEKDLNTEFYANMTLTKELGLLWNAIFNTLGSLLGTMNKDLGQFIAQLVNAKTFSQFVAAVGGSTSLNQSTIASLNPNIQGGINALPGGIPKNSPLSTSNSSITNINNYNISAKNPTTALSGAPASTLYQSTYGFPQ